MKNLNNVGSSKSKQGKKNMFYLKTNECGGKINAADILFTKFTSQSKVAYF